MVNQASSRVRLPEFDVGRLERCFIASRAAAPLVTTGPLPSLATRVQLHRAELMASLHTNVYIPLASEALE
jgi:hypothetical protein